ncbi:MAG: T9SS type A sorting domain-containing protein [Flavobacteriales bacterium]|nr:T9SS type A sorting domain-containing protein [Flavobacteriales bacterium]
MRTQYTLSTITGAIVLALSPFASDAQSRADMLAGKSVRHSGAFVSALRGGGAPANDDCTAPETLTVGEDCASPTPGDNTNATQSEAGPTCDDASTGIWADVWYTFNSGSNTSVDVDLVPGETMTDNVLVVLDACAGTELLCYVLPPAAQSVEVTENTDYIVRVYSNTQYGDPGPFTICVSATPPPPPAPANDDCAAAIALTTGPDCQPTDGYSFGATESQPADSCNGYLGTANDDVWYSFVATATEMTISVQGGEGFDAVVELFEGDCSGLSEIGCADATVGGELEEIFQSGLVVGNTYLVRLFNYGGAEVSPSSFTICAKDGLSGIGMDEGTAAAGTELFPNPAEGVVNITWSGSAADVRIDVLDMTGRCAHSELRHLSKGQITVMSFGDRLPAGAYSVRMTGAGMRVAHRLVLR